MKKLNKITTYDHFWIYKNYDQLEYYYPKKVNWQQDTYSIVQTLFFRFPFKCSASVVLDKYSNYIAYHGEFGKTTIWGIVIELSKKYDSKNKT